MYYNFRTMDRPKCEKLIGHRRPVSCNRNPVWTEDWGLCRDGLQGASQNRIRIPCRIRALVNENCALGHEFCPSGGSGNWRFVFPDASARQRDLVRGRGAKIPMHRVHVVVEHGEFRRERAVCRGITSDGKCGERGSIL